MFNGGSSDSGGAFRGGNGSSGGFSTNCAVSF